MHKSTCSKLETLSTAVRILVFLSISDLCYDMKLDISNLFDAQIQLQFYIEFIKRYSLNSSYILLSYIEIK